MTRLSFFLALVAVSACGGSSGGSTDGSVSGGDDVDAPQGGDGAVPIDGATDTMSTIDAAISNCPDGQWCAETVPVDLETTLIHGVDAVDENDVFAVGNGGVILRRQAGAWSLMTSGSTKDLRGVWAQSGTNAWAVGKDGAALQWNGTSWTAATGAPALDYTAVVGIAANDVWLVGTSTAVHWNGTAFSQLPITGVPVGVSGSAANNLWISSESGYLSHYTTSWQLVMPKDGGSQSLGSSYYSVAVLGTNDVWASTPGNGTIHYDGTGWTARSSGTTLFASLYAASASNLWGVGSTKVGHWDGTAWTVATPIANANSLYGVTGANGSVWAVGANGTILYRHD